MQPLSTRHTPHQTPTKQTALIGGIVGTSIGLISHLLLLEYLPVTITLVLLYAIGVTLILDCMRILQQAPDGDGSWCGIAFGGTIGLVLIVIQLVFRPIVSEEISVLRDYDLPEEVVLLPSNLILVLWLLVFGVAMISFGYGIAMTVADLSES